MAFFVNNRGVNWQEAGVNWANMTIDAASESYVLSNTSDISFYNVLSLPATSNILGETSLIDYILDDNLVWLTVDNSYTSLTSVVDTYSEIRLPVSSVFLGNTSGIDYILDEHIDWVLVDSGITSNTSNIQPYSEIRLPVSSVFLGNTGNIITPLGVWWQGPTYKTYKPTHLFICAGTKNTIEYINPEADTVSTNVNSCAIRTGGYGISNNTYAWLLGGYQYGASEKMDLSSYTDALVPASGLPSVQAGGCSLYGNVNGYLVGDSWSSAVSQINTSTGTVTASTNNIPIRTIENQGRADDEYGWVLGGVRTDGLIYSNVQKIDLATETWSVSSYLVLLRGSAKHGVGHKNKTLWYAGGSSNYGMTSAVNLIHVGFDVSISVFRCALTMPRNLPGSINNGSYLWIIGGENLGEQAVVDRVDINNDTINASTRCNLLQARRDPIVLGELSFITNILGDTDTAAIAVAGIQSPSDRRGVIPYILGIGPVRHTDKLYVAGGQDYNSTYNRIYNLNLIDDTNYVLVNSTLSPRYQLFGTSNTDYSWFSGGVNPVDNPLTTVEKLDHSNDTVAVVPTSNLPVALANGGSVSELNKGYIKSSNYLLSINNSTDVWTSLTGSGNNISVSGAGIGTKGLFGGGRQDLIRSNKVDLLSTDTDTWTADKYDLSVSKYDISGSSVTDTTWFTGGFTVAPVNHIESVEHNNSIATVLSRSTLSTAKSRTSSFANQSYTWVLGGYRLVALSEVDRFDPYSDVVITTPRNLLSAPVHSFCCTGAYEPAERTGDRVRLKLVLAATNDVNCMIHSLNERDTVFCLSPLPMGTYTDIIKVAAPRYPASCEDSVGCVTIGGILHEDTLVACISFGTYTQTGCLAIGLDPYNQIHSISTVDSHRILGSFVSTDTVWIGGGLGVAAYEKITEDLTCSVRGSSLFPRMGAETGTSGDRSWIGGGSTSENIVELFVYSTDLLITGDRTNLSRARSYLAGSNNSRYCWYWGGIDQNGVVGVLDRLDKTNDIVAAIYRCDGLPRCRFKMDFDYLRAYSFGGQIGSVNKDYIHFFDPSNDTSIQSTVSTIFPIADYSLSCKENNFYIFLNKDIHTYDPTVGIYQLIRDDLPNYTQSNSHRLGSKILLTGGTVYTLAGPGAARNRIDTYDPDNDTYEIHSPMNYNRYNHWSQGLTSNTDNYSYNVRSIAPAIYQLSSDIISSVPSCSEEYWIRGVVIRSDRSYTQQNCIAVPPSACTYNVYFEQGYSIDIYNHLWKFNYEGIATDKGILDINNNRTTAVSSGQQGWFLGGNLITALRLNYADETTSIVNIIGNNLESSSCVSNTVKSSILGGCYYGGYVASSDTIRSWDYATETLSNEITVLPRKIYRAAASRGSVDGYLLGGSIGTNFVLSDEIIKFDVETDIATVSTVHLGYTQDLHAAILNQRGEICISNSIIFNPDNDTVTNLGSNIGQYGESFITQSRTGLIIGGATPRTETLLPGEVVRGPISNYITRSYDHTSNTLTSLSPLNTTFFLGGSLFSYSYCTPFIQTQSTLYGVLKANGSYRSWISGYVSRIYWYSDTACILSSCILGESTIGAAYSSYEQSAINALAISKDLQISDRGALVHHASYLHVSEIGLISNSIEQHEDTLNVILTPQQLLSDIKGLTIFPNFYTVVTGLRCILPIGGSVTTRRCYLPATLSVNWNLNTELPDLSLLLNKLVGIGSHAEILNKLVKNTAHIINWEKILQDVSSNFEGKDFIYSVDKGVGCLADEGVLIIPGTNLQNVHLLIKLSGTSVWISNDKNLRFFVSSSVDYDIDGIGILPITGNMMYITLKLIQPLDDMLTFHFKTNRSSCHLKLVSL